jgi:hypothetical protein
MDRLAPFALLLMVLCLASSTGCGSDGGGPDSDSTARGPDPGLAMPAPGSKAAAPGVPVSKHGDNSIQIWGSEGSAEERSAATATVEAYLDARAEKHWSRACRLLTARSRAEQSRIAGGLPCPQATAVLLSRASNATLAREAGIEPLSFRVGSRYAFLIYRRSDGIFAIGMARQGRAWRVVSATANPLT